MIDHDLSDLLERAADRIPVGPPPLDDVLVQATRHRRRRTGAAMMSSAAAVVVAMVGSALLLSPNSTPPPPVVTPSVAATQPSVAATPPGTRLVGLGQAAIAVPVTWGTNETLCGTPKQDTVVIDVGAIGACLTSRPEGIDSVELTQGPVRFDFAADTTSDIGGLPADRQATTCTASPLEQGSTCYGTIFIPSLAVSFRAESSTDKATVDEILSWIRILPDIVGVPGYQSANLQTPQGDARDRYVAAARAEGLEVRVVTEKRPAIDAGFILDVSPEPGTMVPPGTEVTLTVVAEPEGPADEVRVDINSVGPGDSMDYQGLDDDQIRAGATIELGVGDRIWTYAMGKRSPTLAGELDGTSLTIDPWTKGPNYPHSWIATKEGTTRLTITITADGQPVKIGVVTVVVS